MKINRLDAHDRLEYFTKQNFDIGQTCQDIINQRPFGEHSFYIFAHKREIPLDVREAIFLEDLRQSLIDLTYVRKYNSIEEVPTHKIIWIPRLTKPQAQENSMLFKACPGYDFIRVIWMIPDSGMFDAYSKGKMLENKTVVESIHLFKTDPGKLEQKEDDDLPDEVIKKIYEEIKQKAKHQPFRMI
jgi:hypothetical protein